MTFHYKQLVGKILLIIATFNMDTIILVAYLHIHLLQGLGKFYVYTYILVQVHLMYLAHIWRERKKFYLNFILTSIK